MRLEDFSFARQDLVEFIQETKPDYLVNWHHEEICDQLMRFLNEVRLRLTIWVPPRYGKSEIVSKMFPAFLLGIDPTLQIIISSYSAELAEDFNVQIQELMQSEEYQLLFPNTKLKRSTRNKTVTAQNGFVYAVGVGGTLTGKGGDLLIIDDPIKGHKEANSKTHQASLVNWYNSVAQTRLTRDASIIIMHTRWHKKDLAGYVIDKAKDDPDASQFEVICFPAAYEPNHPFASPLDHRTYEGEALWPAFRATDEELKQTKADVGSYVWTALFRQSPKAEGGNIIHENWLRYYTALPVDPKEIKSANLVGSWDLQFKETGTSYTCGIVLLKIKADFYLVDFYHKKADIIESKRAIIAMAKRWPNNHCWLIEDKANGPAILSLLKKEVTGLLPVKPESSKDERLHAVAPIFEAGNFYLPMNHPKTKMIVEELTSFPASENDDIVDAISQGLSRFGKLKGLRYLRAYKNEKS